MDRDFVVIVSTEVTPPTVELLLSECVRVVQLDPFYQNDLAKQLVRPFCQKEGENCLTSLRRIAFATRPATV